MKVKILFLSALTLILINCGTHNNNSSQTKGIGDGIWLAKQTINVTTEILQKMITNPVVPISKELWDMAQCIVVSRTWTGSFVFGGQGSLSTVISCRTPDGWSMPAFGISGGPSFGAQIGVSHVDTLYLYVTSQAKQQLFTNHKVTLGIGIHAIAGSVGLNKQAVLELGADAIVYANRAGLAAGIAVEANWVANAHIRNKNIYNTSDKRIILQTPGHLGPELVQPFVRLLNILQ